MQHAIVVVVLYMSWPATTESRIAPPLMAKAGVLHVADLEHLVEHSRLSAETLYSCQTAFICLFPVGRALAEVGVSCPAELVASKTTLSQREVVSADQ